VTLRTAWSTPPPSLRRQKRTRLLTTYGVKCIRAPELHDRDKNHCVEEVISPCVGDTLDWNMADKRERGDYNARIFRDTLAHIGLERTVQSYEGVCGSDRRSARNS
jgi:hypothetical protein